MKRVELVKNIEKTVRENSPAILTALGVSGTVTTAYLSGRASYRAALIIERHQDANNMTMSRKDKIRLVWRTYIPTVISGATTIACVVSGNRVGTKRTAAAYSLLAVSERAYDEYKEKVIETLGEKKDQTVRDAIAQDRVTANPVSGREIIVTSGGNELCYEAFTGRYFNSDIEILRRAQNELNARILREMYATLSDFYNIIGLSYTSNSCDIGWDSDKLLELKFSTVLADNGRPCISFDYNYTKPI